MNNHATINVLFVCMGNICRSPTAEAVFRSKVEVAGLAERFEIDSAGTHAYHVGKAPDPRAAAVAERRGVRMGKQRARRVSEADFERFDHIIAMDNDNLAVLESLRATDTRASLSLMLSHDPEAQMESVPDPYYGGAQGFEQVFDLLDRAAQRLLDTLVIDVRAGKSPTPRE